VSRVAEKFAQALWHQATNLSQGRDFGRPKVGNAVPRPLGVEEQRSSRHGRASSDGAQSSSYAARASTGPLASALDSSVLAVSASAWSVVCHRANSSSRAASSAARRSSAASRCLISRSACYARWIASAVSSAGFDLRARAEDAAHRGGLVRAAARSWRGSSRNRSGTRQVWTTRDWWERRSSCPSR
jgi:hypothetical protein